MSYGTDAPAFWNDAFADDETSMLEQEQCIMAASSTGRVGVVEPGQLRAVPGALDDARTGE
jgi:hypothetical protein